MAPGWEHYRDYMSARTGHVAGWLVDNVAAKPGDRILDLAGGTGENGFLAAARVGDEGRVLITDFAPQMVDVAKRRAGSLGLSNVETRALDAENMDLDDGSVDGIICRWGFMLMQEPAAALKECRRVLKDGGRLALSVWGGPEKNPWVTVPGMTMVQLGYPPKGDPFGPGGMFSMSRPSQVEEMLRDAGFSTARAEEMEVTWDYESFDEAWEFMTRVAGAIAAVVRELPSSKVDELRAALEANYEDFMTDDGLRVPGVTVNAVAY